MCDKNLTNADKYKELQALGRHYDQKLWLIPGAAYAASAVLYAIIFKGETVLLGRVVLSLLNPVIFLGFLFQFLKDRCFQLENQSILKEYGDQNSFSGDLNVVEQDRWYIRFAKKYVVAANYLFYTMFLCLIVHVLVALYFIISLICG